jgi:hypothetical protein
MQLLNKNPSNKVINKNSSNNSIHSIKSKTPKYPQVINYQIEEQQNPQFDFKLNNQIKDLKEEVINLKFSNIELNQQLKAYDEEIKNSQNEGRPFSYNNILNKNYVNDNINNNNFNDNNYSNIYELNEKHNIEIQSYKEKNRQLEELVVHLKKILDRANSVFPTVLAKAEKFQKESELLKNQLLKSKNVNTNSIDNLNSGKSNESFYKEEIKLLGDRLDVEKKII